MHKRNEPGQDVVADAIVVATRVGRGLLVGLFLASLAALVYYLFKGYIPEFHTDSAFKSLLAEEVVRQGSYFPAEWNYVNGDLWVLFGQIFIIPLLPFFRNSYTLHAVSGLISSLIVLWSLWCVSGMAIGSRWLRLLTVTVFAGGVSWVVAENLFGQVSYGNVLFIAIFTLYFTWRWLQSTRRGARIGWALAMAALVVAAAWGNPQRAVAYDLLPMLAALCAWATTRSAMFTWSAAARRWRPTEDAWRLMAVVSVLFASVALGVLLHSISIAHAHNTAGAGATRWLTFEGARENLWLTLKGVLGMFGALPAADRSLMSLGGAYEGLRLLAMLTLLVMLPTVSVAALRDVRPSARMLGGFAASGLCLFVFLQVTTTTPDMTGPIHSARYLLPSLILGVILLVSYVERQGPRTVGGIAGWSVLLVLLSSLAYSGNSFSRMYRGTPISAHQQAIQELQNQGLHYGYASYWNSGAITILSGGDVRIRQIELQQGVPEPRLHLASRTWFRPDAWKGPSFLMLTHEEMASLDRAAMFTFTGNPIREFTAGEFVVLVFKDNLAATLPNWQAISGAPIQIGKLLNPGTRHEMGRLQSSEGRSQLVSAQGESGFLHFGPYLTLPAGAYQARVDVQSPGNGEAGYVDVVSGLGADVLARQPIRAGHPEPILLTFSAEKDVENFEIRVYSNGSSSMVLSAISLRPAGAKVLRPAN